MLLVTQRDIIMWKKTNYKLILRMTSQWVKINYKLNIIQIKTYLDFQPKHVNQYLVKIHKEQPDFYNEMTRKKQQEKYKSRDEWEGKKVLFFILNLVKIYIKY